MIKFGVQRLEDYRTENSSSLIQKVYSHLSRNRVSYRLLQTEVPASTKEVAVFEYLMQQMRLTSGVYRTTYRQRFRDLDPVVNALLCTRAGQGCYEVEDWAASDCLTSREWADSLLRAIPTATLRASDLTLYLLLVELPGGDNYVVETNGKPLQYLNGPFAIRLEPEEPRELMVNRVLGRRALKRWKEIWKTLKIDSGWLEKPPHDRSAGKVQSGANKISKLPVVHPEAMELMRKEKRFRVEKHSAFEPLPAPVDAIRSMNIFNRSYFPPEQLACGANTVWKSLMPGGIWIVGRTIKENPPVHQVSLFERTSTGFKLIQRHGDASEIEMLVLEQQWG